MLQDQQETKLHATDLRICTIFFPAWGSTLQLGVFRFFFHKQINSDSLGEYVTKKCEEKLLWKAIQHTLQDERTLAHIHVWRLQALLFVFIFVCVVSKNLNTPNWSSMDDDAITRDSIVYLQFKSVSRTQLWPLGSCGRWSVFQKMTTATLCYKWLRRYQVLCIKTTKLCLVQPGRKRDHISYDQTVISLGGMNLKV